MNKKTSWDRSQATVKLVGRRKALLEQISRAHAPGCSPVEAIDRALELATAPDEMDLVSRLYAVEDLLVHVDEARRQGAAKLEARLAHMAESLDSLNRLIRELAGEM